MTSETMVSLTDEQAKAVEVLTSSDKQVQTLGGLAGTGKTTVIRELAKELSSHAICAYTGKATQVLRKKGLTASTIHSLIYRAVELPGGGVEFQLRTAEEFEYGGIIVDEGSMVPRALHDDMMTLNVPVIFVGDHGQLEPVGGEDFNLMRDPDVTLETIHRNAGEIARFAEHLRKGGDARDWTSEGAVTVISPSELEEWNGTEADQIICAFNRTRVEINELARENLDLPRGVPVRGDRVICLQNDRKSGLFNGMQGVLADVWSNRLLFKSDQFEVMVRHVPQAFGSERTPERRSGLVPFDWAWCVTCHKAQGDEWNRVTVVEQRCRHWEHKRWAYTAASRAKQALIWVLGD